jgi:hypothetical protein
VSSIAGPYETLPPAVNFGLGENTAVLVFPRSASRHRLASVDLKPKEDAMRWKFARLLVVIGAFLLVEDYYSPVRANYGSCACDLTIYTMKFPLVNPTCGIHPYFNETETLQGSDCYTWCDWTAQDLVAYYCGVDTCDLGWTPGSGSYQGYATWDGEYWAQYHVSDYSVAC